VPFPPPPGAIRRPGARARVVVATPSLRNRVAIERDEARVGRAPDCDIALGHESVSPRHALIRARGDGFEIIDARSKTGTSVGGVALAPETPVALGARAALRFGEVSCLFCNDPASGAGDPPPERLIEILIAEGAISAPQAREVLEEARQRSWSLGEVLVLRGVLTPERLVEVLLSSAPAATPARGWRWIAVAVVLGLTVVAALAFLAWRRSHGG
jgi:hypothetical protein